MPVPVWWPFGGGGAAPPGGEIQVPGVNAPMPGEVTADGGLLHVVDEILAYIVDHATAGYFVIHDAIKGPAHVIATIGILMALLSMVLEGFRPRWPAVARLLFIGFIAF